MRMLRSNGVATGWMLGSEVFEPVQLSSFGGRQAASGAPFFFCGNLINTFLAKLKWWK